MLKLVKLQSLVLPPQMLQQDGIWYAPSNRPAISYPESGNADCLQIEADSFWFTHRNRCLLELLRVFPPQGLFFDVGGGNGFVSLALETAGWPTVLVEPGEAGAQNARRRGLQHVVCATLEDIQLPENSLPAVGLFDVVEHIEADLDFLRQVFRVLQPGGHVFITVPAYEWLWSNEDVDAGHFRRYSRASIARTLRQAGFEVAFETYIFSFLPAPIFFFRTLPSRLGFNKNAGSLQKQQQEHRHRAGFLQKTLDAALNWELQRLRQGKSLPFGSSCLIVGRKI